MKPNMKNVSNPPALSKMGGNVRTARAGSIKKDRAAGIGSVPNTKGGKSLTLTNPASSILAKAKVSKPQEFHHATRRLFPRSRQP